MNDDRFMHSLRREPRREFARTLWQRLSSLRDEEAEAPRPRFALVPSLAAFGAVLAVISLFVFPSVRVSAQAFLDLFRVRTFTPVAFDPDRMQKLGEMERDTDISGALFERSETAPPRKEDAPSREAAEAVAGIPVLEPSNLPKGLTRESFQTIQYEDFRMTINTEKLRAIIDALDLRDVDTPEGLNGRPIDVNLHPAVIQKWTNGNGKRKVELVQARSPEVSLPPGTDLAQLGETGLRILGLDPAEARRIARSVDWNSTLVVPVPMTASSFREVTVRGNQGLLVTISKPAPEGVSGDEGRREGSVLLWTEGDRVMALNGNIESEDLLVIAESLR